MIRRITNIPLGRPVTFNSITPRITPSRPLTTRSIHRASNSVLYRPHSHACRIYRPVISSSSAPNEPYSHIRRIYRRGDSTTSTYPRLFHSSAIRRSDEPFRLSDIGEGITEVEIISWTVKEGDIVEEFDTLCEVQSDKSTVELTAPFTGKVHSIGFKDGDMVKVGQVLCRIMTEGESTEEVTLPSISPIEHAEPEPSKESQSTPQPEKASSHSWSSLDQQSEDGSIPPPPPREIVRPRETASESTSPIDRALLSSLRTAADAGDSHSTSTDEASLWTPKDEGLESAGSASFSGEASIVRGHEPKPFEVDTTPVPKRRLRPEREGQREIVKTSPAVRTLAARLGVKLEDVRPTGEGGRVTQMDVQAAAGVSQSQGQTLEGNTGDGKRTVVSVERSKIPEITRVDFGRTRKVMYRAMGDMAHVPHFGYSHTLNLTSLMPYLRAMNTSPSPTTANYMASDIPSEHARDPLPISSSQKTTLLSFLIKGLLLAMEEHPIMRSRAKEVGHGRVLEISRDGVIGVAVSDPKYGLVTPSLPSLPPSTSLTDLTSALTTLRTNPTKPSQPANLTISSVGGLGEARDMMPVLPPGGGLAICAVGRAKWEMEWKKASGKGIMDMTPEDVERGGMAAVLRCPVGWSGDHRVLEGAELIAFTETWKKYIEEPWRWLNVN